MNNKLKLVSETKEMLEAILNAIDEGIHVVNKDGISIYYNHIAARHDGLEIGEVLNRHISDVFPSLDSENSTLLKVIKTGEPIINHHQQYTNKNGQKVTAINTTLPVYVNQNLVGAVEITKDITKIKELSEKLIDLQAKVQPVSLKKGNISQAKYHFDDIITKNLQMEKLIKLAKKFALSDSAILIEGETGTGKELFVQAIHNQSDRREQPFIAQNCAALPPTLLEGILFGTVKGSFTGAENRPGLFELAHNGTLFLDEINSMPIELQAKLLRVLQDGLVRRVGDSQNRQVNARVIVATNLRSIEAVEKGQIRSDLYYRINVVSLKIPPLRERKDDISLLTQYFIQKYNYRFKKLILSISQEVDELFKQYNWPGNVRELEHTIEYVMNIIEGDRIELYHLPDHLQNRNKREHFSEKSLEDDSINEFWEEEKGLKEYMEELEKNLIAKALKQEKGNINRTAQRLKIPRQTLQYKIGKYLLQ